MVNTTMRGRFPLLLLLGILFLASVSVTYGALAYWEKENPCQDKCLQSCTAENDVKRHEACLARCNQARRCRPEHEEGDEDEEEREQTPRRRQQHGHRPQRREKEEEEEEERGQHQPRRQWQHEQERRRQEQERQERRPKEQRGEEEEEEDEDEDDERSPWGQRRQEQERRRREQQRKERRQRHQEDEEDEDEDEDDDERSPWGQRRQEQERRRREQQRQERQRRRQRESEDEEEDEDEDEDERSPWWGQRRHEQERRRREQERRQRRTEDEEDEDEDEDEDERSPWGKRRQEKQRRRQRETEDEEEDEDEDEEQEWRVSRGSRHQIQRRGSQSQRSSRNNPFYFPRSRFQTLYKNEHGWIRMMERFDRRSDELENLQNHRIVEIEARPNTLVLPKHADAESLIVIQDGAATVHLANPDDRDSYNLERGDALRISAGTISYIVNRNDNKNLRIAKLLIPVNQPGRFDDFFPATNEEQESYFEGFSRKTLEASFNAPFSEIERTLLQDNEEERRGEREEESEGVIVKLSREQIQELSKHAKSSRKRGSSSSSSESGPFSLRSRKPIHENNFGRFFEVTPNKNNPQLQDLDIHLTCIEIREGGLMLPHFNSEATVVIVVNQGRGNLELVALRDQNQQQWREQEDEDEEEEEEEGNKQVHRYTARLSRGDIVVIPAAHPFAINASSDLHLLGFGINAQNNQRNFLAGENDNVLNQIHRQVKEIAFPGSGEQVERLLTRQRKSYFVSAQPQQQPREERGSGRRGPLSSILNAFY